MILHYIHVQIYILYDWQRIYVCSTRHKLCSELLPYKYIKTYIHKLVVYILSCMYNIYVVPPSPYIYKYIGSTNHSLIIQELGSQLHASM